MHGYFRWCGGQVRTGSAGYGRESGIVDYKHLAGSMGGVSMPFRYCRSRSLVLRLVSMSRLPCSACGGETLVAVLEANGGLCARCVKGERPCVICGQRVSRPLPGDIYMHWECRDRAEAEAKDLDWESDEDIDWNVVRTIYRRKLDLLHDHIAARQDAPPAAHLLFYTEFNGGWCFDVVGEVSDSELENYGRQIPGWDEDPEGYENAFAILDHDLDGDDIAERINERFLTILSAEVELLAERNFGFPESTEVTWKVHD